MWKVYSRTVGASYSFNICPFIVHFEHGISFSPLFFKYFVVIYQFVIECNGGEYLTLCNRIAHNFSTHIA